MDYKGAFAALSDSAVGAAAKQQAGAALGSYGVPDALNPYAAVTTANPVAPVTGQTANTAKEDAQGASGGIGSKLGAIWSKYRNLILIGTALALGGWLLLKRRK